MSLLLLFNGVRTVTGTATLDIIAEFDAVGIVTHFGSASLDISVELNAVGTGGTTTVTGTATFNITTTLDVSLQANLAVLRVIVPDEIAMGYPTVIFAEYSDIIRAYPVDDSPQIKLFRIDNAGTRQNLQGPGLMAALGEGYTYTWTPTQEGAYVIQVLGSVVGEQKMGIGRTTVRPKWEQNVLNIYNLLVTDR